jgi:Fe-S-cluster containining protein
MTGTPDWQPLAGPARRYPARADAQGTPRDDRAICSRCLGGTCCTTEGPIALTAFDVLRLSAALDLAPAAFFRLFTQDRFEGTDGERYRQWLADPANSVVSFLRRRTLDAASPCIFLKYITQDDGTPRRVCSVHAARPLACREYYFDTCKKRWTGEMAVLQAIGYEALRDGAVDAAAIERQLAACAVTSKDEALSTSWRRAFWLELRRALQPEAANHEGAAQPRLAELQDAIDAKINRLLSTPNLRFEEKYGPLPSAEQLHSFAAGMAMLDSAERTRLLHIATQTQTQTGPRPHLFTADDLAPHLGVRELLATVDSAASSRVDELLRFARRARQAPDLMELESPVAMHLALCVALRRQPDAAQANKATKARISTAMAWHAAAALTHGVAALQTDGPFEQVQLEAANGLAVLAAAGHRTAATALRRWLASPRAAPCKRAWRELAAHLRAAPRPAAPARPPAADAACWLPLIVFCASAVTVRRLLKAVWTHPQLKRLDAEAMLTLADHSLRQPLFDRALLAPALPTLRDFVAQAPASMWDVRPSEMGERWHDAYVLRAIDRAGMLAEVRRLLNATATQPGHRRRAIPVTR